MVGFKKIKFWTNENIGAGQLELPENEMHTTSYWITLERALVEALPFSLSERQNGMLGLLYALESMAALLLMCDRRDLGTAIGERPPAPGAPAVGARHTLPQPPRRLDAPAAGQDFFEPNLYLYDAYPGGIGFSEPLFDLHATLLARTRELVASCPCEQGCPSCVGPSPDSGERTKQVALAILDRLCSPSG